MRYLKPLLVMNILFMPLRMVICWDQVRKIDSSDVGTGEESSMTGAKIKIVGDGSGNDSSVNIMIDFKRRDGCRFGNGWKRYRGVGVGVVVSGVGAVEVFIEK